MTTTIYYRPGAKKSLQEVDFSSAKEVIVSDNITHYYILRRDSSFANPYDSWELRVHSKKYKYVKVRKEVFDAYMKFLKTGNHMFLTKSERIFP